MSKQNFRGRGWQFPPTFSLASGQVVMADEQREIEDSLTILLGTTVGERLLQPEYGLNMQDQLFESLNTTRKTLLKDRITRTLLVYEPRINVLSVDLDDRALNEGKLTISIDYQIRASNSRFNLVYPYYLHDGSEVSPSV